MTCNAHIFGMPSSVWHHISCVQHGMLLCDVQGNSTDRLNSIRQCLQHAGHKFTTSCPPCHTMLAALTAPPTACGGRAFSASHVPSTLHAFWRMQGTICTVCGTTLAAVTAFNISRGIGRRFAERVVSEEMKSENEEQSAMVQNKFQGVQNAIENGSFAQQTLAVAALRLTPVVPFRYSISLRCLHCATCASCAFLAALYAVKLFGFALNGSLSGYAQPVLPIMAFGQGLLKTLRGHRLSSPKPHMSHICGCSRDWHQHGL